MRLTLPQGLPATTLYSAYVNQRPEAMAFYSRDWSLDSIGQFARQRAALTSSHREQLCAALAEQQRNWGAGSRGVEKIASGAVAVVTGQQPILFAGPLYSIFKAASAVKIADALERSGIPAVPVFWVASEDHDFKEIEETWVLNKNSELSRIAVDLSGDQPSPAGWLSFKEDVRAAITQCVGELPESEFAPALQHLLEECYQPGASPVDGFARLMARLFAHTELTFLNPLHEKLRVLAQPTIDLAIRRNSEMRNAVQARNKELTAAGFHEQVRVDDGFTGLFSFQGKARVAVRPADLRQGMQWSPNVLLRPAMQDTLLPTAAYIGGPAEVAYFAQAAAVYDTLGLPMPPVVPRISATVVEPRVSRIADKYGIELEDAFKGREHIRRKVVGALGDGDPFEAVRGAVQTQLETLRPRLEAVDVTLVGALDTALQKIGHQVETLKGKYVSAVARRDETLERHLALISNALFPDKKPQERVLNFASFFIRYGPDVTRRLTDSLRVDTHEHQVVEI